jgi:carbon monoxide dehydrogenase subunit G
MTKIESIAVIDRPAEVVWKFISDNNNAPKWNPGVLELKQISTGPLGVGTTLQSRWSTRLSLAVSRITEFEPGRKLTAEVTSPRMLMGSRESLSLETVEGKTKLTSVWELKFNGIYKLVGPFQVGGVRRFNEARVINLKRILESGVQS